MQPGDLTQKLLGEHGLQALHKALTTKPPGPDPVEDFCTRHNLDYESISELNSDKAAFSSAFWDPDGSWIVLAFKGDCWNSPKITIYSNLIRDITCWI